MKNLKKLIFGLVALVMAFGLLFSVSAFSSKESKRSYSYWQYEPGSMTGIRTASNYTLVSEPVESPCEAGSDLPCVLRVAAAIDNETALNTYLNDYSTFPADQDIKTSAFYKKVAD